MLGQTISHYRIIDRLGQGGMGIVYKAEDTRLDRTVALKFLPPSVSTDPEAKERFTREAKAASGLDHPNICSVYEIGETAPGADEAAPPQLFIVMPYYDGQTLKYRLDGGPLLVEEVVSIGAQIAEGLERAHEAGIVHRDLKPDNIMITRRGRVKILDFGVAKLGAESELTKMGSTVGTTSYMSPEQARGDEVDVRTDLWSLGIVMYQMLTGTLPFKGDYEQAIVYGILNEDPDPIDELRPDTPEELLDLITLLMQKDREDRPPSAAAVADVLGRTGPVNRASRATVRAADRERVVPTWLAVASGAVLIVAVAVFAWTQLRPDATEDAASAALDAIVVLPFDVQAGPDLAYLSRGMVTMISPMIDGLGTLRAVDQRAVLGWVDQMNDTYIDPADGREIARHFGSSRYILGSILQAGPEVRISASLYNSVGEIEREASSSYTDEAGLLSAVDEMLQTLFTGVVSGADFSLSSLAGSTTRSFAAMKAYVQAEEALRRDQGPLARELAAQVVEHDSTFALGWYMRGRTHSMDGQVETARSFYRTALRHAGTASPRVRDLIEARLASSEGRQHDAVGALERLARLYPDDVETTGLLGDTYYHTNPIFGRPADQAIPYFEQVLRYDPDNGEYLAHLSVLYAKYQRWNSLDSLYLATLDQVDNRQLPTLQGVHAFHFGDRAARDSVASARMKNTELLFGPQWLVWHLAMGEMVDALTEYSVAMEGEDVDFPAEYNVAAYRMIRGQPSQALEAVSGVTPEGFWLFLSAAPTLLPYLPASPDSLATQRARLAAWDTVATPLLRGGGETTDYPEFQRDALAQRLGILAERQGDVGYLSELATQLASGQPAALTRGISWELQARASLLEGRLEDALAEVDSAHVPATWIDQTGSPEVNGYQRRFLKARILFELGRYEEAARWANSVHDGFQIEMLELLPATLLLEAESYERMGDSERAIEKYGRFLDLWKDAEPELQPTVDEMRARLERLLVERTREPR
jgi:tetratricopeptide (TPR) repeat protein/tRNA A-37 threonylcarbamoyl transferase component Bud32